MNLPFLLVYALICLILSLTWASKKRIGEGWGFFFLFFTSILIGVVVIGASPSKTRIKEMKDGVYRWDSIVGWIAVAMALLIMIGLFGGAGRRDFYSDEENNARTFQAIVLLIGAAGTAYYMFTRFQRHEKLYNEANDEVV